MGQTLHPAFRSGRGKRPPGGKTKSASMNSPFTAQLNPCAMPVCHQFRVLPDQPVRRAAQNRPVTRPGCQLTYRLESRSTPHLLDWLITTGMVPGQSISPIGCPHAAQSLIAVPFGDDLAHQGNPLRIPGSRSGIPARIPPFPASANTRSAAIPEPCRTPSPPRVRHPTPHPPDDGFRGSVITRWPRYSARRFPTATPPPRPNQSLPGLKAVSA